ncbi:MAG: metallophosphoesterase, partial [Limnochordales bacterium]
MRIFAIGDLHLPGGQDKPMDVFGPGWADHPQKIRRAWLEVVGAGDVVLMPGDLSWAMTLEQVQGDFQYLATLPGRIVLIRGNHDYWWSSISKVRRALPPNVTALTNDHLPLPRGWAV